MSTHIDEKTNGCYSITARRFYGGKERGLMTQLTIDNGRECHCIALDKQQTIDFCVNIIDSLNKFKTY